MRHQGREVERATREFGLGEAVSKGSGVPGREKQVDHREHTRQTAGEFPLLRHPIGDAGSGDLLLGAGHAGRHRRQWHYKQPGDGGGVQTADQAKRERNPRLKRNRRMATGENEPQSIVRNILHRVVVGFALRHYQQWQLAGEGRFAPLPIDHLSPGGGDQPGGWTVRNAVALPRFERGEEGILRGILGQVEIARGADERPDHP